MPTTRERIFRVPEKEVPKEQENQRTALTGSCAWRIVWIFASFSSDGSKMHISTKNSPQDSPSMQSQTLSQLQHTHTRARPAAGVPLGPCAWRPAAPGPKRQSGGRERIGLPDFVLNPNGFLKRNQKNNGGRGRGLHSFSGWFFGNVSFQTKPKGYMSVKYGVNPQPPHLFGCSEAKQKKPATKPKARNLTWVRPAP